MKVIVKVVLVSLIIMAIAACASGEQYGTIPASMQQSSVKDVVLNPASAGKEVLLKGKIKTQCGGNGCWIFLDDGTGQILVSLTGLNLGLPQSIGKSAEVYGIVTASDQQMAINARGLKVK